jgi:ABC-type polysaccharide/polyol phosphate transport system ATPase subunit
MASSSSVTSSAPALAASHVSKTFRVPEERRFTLKERALHPRRRVRHQTFRALNDVSFAVAQGEFFGIAGRNGSGKSTLLKCLAGIYGADGQIWRRGRLSTMIELGVGFNPELAARDNVVLNGIMLGLTPREARKRYESVIDFAELREFQDLKLKNYSSGMHVRLAFSVAVHVDAEILLVDEILAVGDAAFQQKCFDVFHRLRNDGKTVVFVTHDMGSLQLFCHRAMLLERGTMVHLGHPSDVADKYLEVNFGRDPGASESSGARSGDGEARVIDVWVEDEHGERRVAVRQGQRISLRVLVEFVVDVEDPHTSVHVHNQEQKAVMVASTVLTHERVGRFSSGDQALYSFWFDNVLAPGRYNPVVTVAHGATFLDVMDRYASEFSFLVTASHKALGGIVDLPIEGSVTRTPAAIDQKLRA